MKCYLITTGALFGIMTAIHIWKVAAEWHSPASDPWFAVGMAAIVLIPAALSCWAWRLLRKL
jgi:hypothetical protein